MNIIYLDVGRCEEVQKKSREAQFNGSKVLHYGHRVLNLAHVFLMFCTKLLCNITLLFWFLFCLAKLFRGRITFVANFSCVLLNLFASDFSSPIDDV